MSVEIGAIEDMPEAEFAELQRAKRARAANPRMEELLDRVAAGRPQRVPLGPDHSARGPRVAIARAAGRRGLSVDAIEGEGFVAVRQAEGSPRSKSERRPTTNGRRARGRARQQAEGANPTPDDLSETIM